MKPTMRAVCALMLAMTSGMVVPALAATRARACGPDEHIRCAVYDRDQVYEVATAKGKAVLIEFEAGEVLEDNGTGIGGEPKAWAGAAGKNWIFLQPAMPHADTNLVVVTNRRTYTFSLVTAAKGKAATWVLRFDYPDTRAKRAADAARKAQAANAISAGGAAQANHLNDAYSMRGDVGLAPSAVWDDGVFTYFRYSTGGALPRVFRLLPDGSEGQPNFHMDGDTIVVHTVEKGFVIRLGDAVVGIRNDGWSPQQGEYNAAGTTVPGMVRIVRDHEGDQP